jgi:hypothetical protein
MKELFVVPWWYYVLWFLLIFVLVRHCSISVIETKKEIIEKDARERRERASRPKNKKAQ